MVSLATTSSCSSPTRPPPAEQPRTGPAPGAEQPGWRTETWAGLSVDVPVTWEYGAAPARLGGSLAVCGPVAGVGRPVPRSDVCAVYPWLAGLPITQPYVWLGADLEPGVVRYEGGLVQETVAAQGTTLTVASPDAALRSRILGSARPARWCGDAPPAAGEVELCGYRRTASGERVLGFAERVATGVAEAVLAAARRAPRTAADPGCGPLAGEVVELREPDRRIVLDLGCGTVDPGDGERRRLTDEAVEPWASPMARASLTYLIGPQG
ncbi:hypothetical protein [Nocardioides nitrophenolicus]|uniref:hypothetical protein n=1 Tax=Nocardioides nitrophenolicus TaxID=60489 RepID=UPI00195CAE26|nr:hypothetical protein [Nocardioides nitrophenolicus]